MAAAAISCLLHAGLVALLVMAPIDPTALQLKYDAQAQLYPNEEQVTTVVYIPDDAQQITQKFPAQTTPQSPIVMSLIEPDFVIPEPDLTIEDDAKMLSAEHDHAALATARTAYLSQIQARIERSWDHPLIALGRAFRCQVKIQQTHQGGIKSLTLADCDGDEAWQQSLLRAVRNAAPFPAPHDEQAFIEELTLDFRTEPVSLAALFTLLETLPETSRSDSVNSQP